MRVVITGASGLIGSRLAAALLAAGHGVVGTSRRADRLKGLPEAVEGAVWDGLDAERIAAVIAGADAVVHLVGENIGARRWTESRKRALHDSRVSSTSALAEALARGDGAPRIWLQASAVGFYGDRGGEELDEESGPGAGFLADLCREWEAAGERAESAGVRRVLLRTAPVLAAEGAPLDLMARQFRLFAGGHAGSGEQWFPWIHVADEVAAIRHLLDSPEAAGPYNLVAPEALTNRRFCSTLGRVLRRPAWLPAPALLLRVAVGEMADVLLASLKVTPRRLLDQGFAFRYPEAEGALGDLLG